MPVYEFKTIQSSSEGAYKEKGSKFLAFAYPVHSEGDIKIKIEALKKSYFDARHHCFAWILGPDKNRFRVFDDGEPNHSAGDPILGQIRSRDLTNVLVVVVRYFGGVKLGVGGLASAYKSAALDALNNAVVVQEEVKARHTLKYDYSVTAEVMRLVKEFDLDIIQQNFSDECVMEVQMGQKDNDRFLEKLALMKVRGLKLDLE